MTSTVKFQPWDRCVPTYLAVFANWRDWFYFGKGCGVLHVFCNPQCWQPSCSLLIAQSVANSGTFPLALRPEPTAPLLPFSGCFSSPFLGASGIPRGSYRGAQCCTEVCTHWQPHALRIFGPPGSLLKVERHHSVLPGWPEGGTHLPQGWNFTVDVMV